MVLVATEGLSSRQGFISNEDDVTHQDDFLRQFIRVAIGRRFYDVPTYDELWLKVAAKNTDNIHVSSKTRTLSGRSNVGNRAT
ncbi:unnamed protein product [Larinioides sclopetarius]|uniref:Uncharacterized protein n=1 Tax=Larinioides sclopetarius TaxID=280406 RepID=A0AAV1ZTR0_9ARAC